MKPEKLESEVVSLLKLQGWSVSPERIQGHKKIDAHASKYDDFGLLQTIAVEIKSGKSGISRTEISQIYADYLPLVQSSQVDFILLVTECKPSPSGMTYISENKYIKHLSYQDLLNRVIDFSHYVAGLRAQFFDSELADRYIPQNFQEGDGTLESKIIAWAQSIDSQPIAILGGYGLGKSTLARRISSKFAALYENDPSNRIPILIPLSYLATDQTLEGLLGRLFTTHTSVHNYNYDLFLALNRRGKFLILLDGFDEMKRSMSWESLRYNLSQLNRLIDENSKVMLLGRPTAFLSSEEHDEALHGRRMINSQERKIPDWPDYKEYHLLPFTRVQVEEYLNKVLTLIEAKENDDSDKSHKLRSYLKKIQGTKGRRLVDLVSRPVQLKNAC